jgi:hypothetical protein
VGAHPQLVMHVNECPAIECNMLSIPEWGVVVAGAVGRTSAYGFPSSISKLLSFVAAANLAAAESLPIFPQSYELVPSHPLQCQPRQFKGVSVTRWTGAQGRYRIGAGKVVPGA